MGSTYKQGWRLSMIAVETCLISDHLPAHGCHLFSHRQCAPFLSIYLLLNKHQKRKRPPETDGTQGGGWIDIHVLIFFLSLLFFFTFFPWKPLYLYFIVFLPSFFPERPCTCIFFSFLFLLSLPESPPLCLYFEVHFFVFTFFPWKPAMVPLLPAASQVSNPMASAWSSGDSCSACSTFENAAANPAPAAKKNGHNI